MLLFILQQSPFSQTLEPNPFLEATKMKSSLKKLDQCFCEVYNYNYISNYIVMIQLSGPVDVCCCDVETVDSLNNNKIYPVISSLVKKSYFRYFKVGVAHSITYYHMQEQINLHRDCPFWSDDGRCVLKDCHVEHCPEVSMTKSFSIKLLIISLGKDTFISQRR